MLLSHPFFCVASIAVTLGGGLAAPTTFSTRETVIPSAQWLKRGVPHPEHVINLRIGLSQPNLSILEQHLYEISDPDHERYGSHLSKEEVDQLAAPHVDSLVAVDKWLASYGILEDSFTRSAAKDWVKVAIPVNLAEKLLNTKFYIWVHSENDETIVRTTSYDLPGFLDGHVDVVQPTTIFAQFKKMRSTFINFPQDSNEPSTDNSATVIDTPNGPVDSSCEKTITIQCLQQLYGMQGYKPSGSKNSIGITGYLDQFANKQDLQLFYADQRLDALKSSFEEVLIKGGLNDQNVSKAGQEANLDVQFGFGLSYPIPGTFYSTGGSPPFKPDAQTPTNTNEPYLEWIEYVLGSSSIPRVISTSYGDDEQTVPRDYAIRVCNELAKLGAMGVTLLFSSGDYGVGDDSLDPGSHKCYTNDGLNSSRFLPSFPASCPFVTTVGGTQDISPEVAVTRFYSGGGFSDYFPSPAYQRDAVGSYLSNLPSGQYNGLYNPRGRAYPDVSAQGDRYRIFVSGKPILIGGTSASAPTFAAVVAVLNDIRIQAGKSSLGFLNPLIYSKGGQGLNDITVGNNAGCGTKGFNATKGWDPVTGLGTPNFPKLRDIIEHI